MYDTNKIPELGYGEGSMYPYKDDLLCYRKNTNDFGGGYQHHLRDFSHHPTLIGIESFIMMII